MSGLENQSASGNFSFLLATRSSESIVSTPTQITSALSASPNTQAPTSVVSLASPLVSAPISSGLTTTSSSLEMSLVLQQLLPEAPADSVANTALSSVPGLSQTPSVQFESPSSSAENTPTSVLASFSSDPGLLSSTQTLPAAISSPSSVSSEPLPQESSSAFLPESAALSSLVASLSSSPQSASSPSQSSLLLSSSSPSSSLSSLSSSSSILQTSSSLQQSSLGPVPLASSAIFSLTLSSSWTSSVSSSTETASSSELASSLSLSASSRSRSSDLALPTSSSESSQTPTSSATSSFSSSAPSITEASSSTSGYYVSTISVLPDTTITTLITIPTTASSLSSSSGSSVSLENAKIIGGVVGAVGGALLIGLFALLVFLKKRKKKVTNQLPDFADEALGSDNEKSTGFLKLFGAKGSTANTGGGVSTYNGLENQVNVRSASVGAGAATDAGDNNDFEYRGVTNSNNLDSIFRSTGSNTGHNSSGFNSANETPRQGNSRFNSMVVPFMKTMHEGDQEHDGASPGEAPYPTEENDALSSLAGSDKSSEYATDDDLLLHADPHQFWAGEHHSNNSRLRFTEDLA